MAEARLSPSDDEQFATAIGMANIPTLLMVLVQLTGDLKWLEPPYRPVRARGMGDNDDGGLPEDIQAEIRAAALRAITRWRGGERPAIEQPEPELLVRMLAVAMGEPVPAEYGEFTAAQLGLVPEPPVAVKPEAGIDVLIVGAGASGLCAAINLARAGVPFEILEQRDRVGGVWYENRYPGAGVDTPNHLYSFSFLAYDWPMYFALRDDLHAYMEHVATEFDLHRHIRLDTAVQDARWDDAAQQWVVTARDADGNVSTRRARVLISATGIFNPPVMPDIDGLDDFAGPSFHSTRWPADLDLAGKRVAVIGNGASAMQICPEIAPQVDTLTIFQRSTHWAAPFEKFRQPVPEPMRFLLREMPIYRAWYRVRLGWTFNDRIHQALQKDHQWPHAERSLNAINDAHRRYFTDYVKSELGDRTDLIDKVLPSYPPWGKRMLMDNGWYRMLLRDNVELVDTPIARIEADAVVTGDGTRHAADVLVIATGFDVLNFGTAFEVHGRSGRSLRETWGDNGRAWLGMAVPDFPNFFTLYGPNTQPGHGGSLIFVIEMQLHYLMSLLAQMSEAGITSVEVDADVHARYNDAIDAAHENMVWTHPGMETYYRNSIGRVVVNYPWRNVDLFEATRAADLKDYRTVGGDTGT